MNTNQLRNILPFLLLVKLKLPSPNTPNPFVVIMQLSLLENNFLKHIIVIFWKEHALLIKTEEEKTYEKNVANMHAYKL